jgi:hypothetical protein
MGPARSLVPDQRVEAALQYARNLKIDAPWETNGQGQILVKPPIGLAHAKHAQRLIYSDKRWQCSKSVVQEICSHRSVGAGGR